MEILLIIFSILLFLVVILFLIILTKIFGKNSAKKNVETEKFLQNDIQNLRSNISNLSENLAKSLRENSDNLRDKFDEKLDKTQNSMANQLNNSAKIVAEISTRLQKLDDTNKRVINVAEELKTLQNVLTNTKTRGNLGEYYLENVLGNVLPPTVWQRQYRFAKNANHDELVADAVVKLKDGKILPIDSKFSLENYNKMVEAKDKNSREIFAKNLKIDLKKRIDETAKYILPEENTMDFAFMFIPSEALYYDAIINDVGQGGSSRDLIDYAFNEKKVIIVSPTTLLAYLQTVLQGLRSLQIEEQAKEIQKNVAKLKNHLAKYEEFHAKLGNSLRTTVNHFENSDKEFAKIDKDVVKIAGENSSAGKILAEKND